MPKEDKSRPYTSEEMRDRLLDAIWDAVDVWASYGDKTVRQKLEGVAFSICSALDGCRVNLSAFKIAPAPHPDDKAFCIREGMNWTPDDGQDIGPLHDYFHKRGRSRGVPQPVEARDERTLEELAKEALLVQDACNLRGVLGGYRQAMIRLAELVASPGFARHPISVLWADKVAHLSGTQFADLDSITKAYAHCKELAEGRH